MSHNASKDALGKIHKICDIKVLFCIAGTTTAIKNLIKKPGHNPKKLSKSTIKSNSVISENSSQDTFKKYWNQFFAK